MFNATVTSIFVCKSKQPSAAKLCLSDTNNGYIAVVYFSKENFDFVILVLQVGAIFFPSEEQLLDH
jgi:hypothetical protein